MKNLAVLIIITVLLISCHSQGKETMKNKNTIPNENQRVTTIAVGQEGFLNTEAAKIDRIEIFFFKTMNNKKPEAVKNITDKTVILELTALLAELPARGDVFKKLAPTSRYCLIRFFEKENLAGEAKIYNGSLQMADTAFLAHENKTEELFVQRINEFR